MSELTAEETLIVGIATSTCFAFPFESAEIPSEDVDRCVGELLKLYELKPDAVLDAEPDPPEDLRSGPTFCADRLADTFPAHSAELRAALGAG